MKKILLAVKSISVVLVMICLAKFSTAQDVASRKIMVLAKFDNPRYTADMEDAMLRELRANGHEGLVAHKSIGNADAATEEAFIAKLKDLGVTGLILFGDGSMRTQYRNNPSINAGVNVPVRIGIFRAYIGGNVPIGGGTRKEQKVLIHAYYFDKEGEDARWETLLRGNLNKGSVELARKFAGTTYKKLRKQPFF